LTRRPIIMFQRRAPAAALAAAIAASAAVGSGAALTAPADSMGAALAPPPAPAGPPPFSFTPGYGNWMVLQQAPAQAAVYGVLGPGGTAVQVTVTDTATGEAYTVDAALNSTNQPVGYQDPSGAPYPVTASWKALLRPTSAGGDYEISATCAGCTGGNTTITLTNHTFGDVWCVCFRGRTCVHANM
jgi:hypothetical protein